MDISNRVNGEYWKENGVWFALTPIGTLANLNKHDITEHEDGTITVSPSILTKGETVYHGFLEKGAWRTV